MTELWPKGQPTSLPPHSMRSWRGHKPRLDCDVGKK